MDRKEDDSTEKMNMPTMVDLETVPGDETYTLCSKSGTA